MKLSKRNYIILLVLIYTSVLLFGNDFLFSFIPKFSSLKSYFQIIGPSIFIVSSLYDFWKQKIYLKLDKKNYIILGISIMLVIWSIISMLFGINKSFTNINGLVNLLIILGLINLIFVIDFNEKECQAIKKNILISFLIVIIIGIIQYFLGFGMSSSGVDKYGIKGRITSTFYISTLLDKYVVLMITYIYFLILVNNKKIYYVILVLACICLALTFSRSGFIIFLIITFLFLLVSIFKKKYFNFLIVIISLVIMLFINGFPLVAQSSLNYIYEKTNFPEILRLDITKIIYNNKNFNGIDTDNDGNISNDIIEEDDKIANIDDISQDKSLSSRSYFSKIGLSVVKKYPIFGIGIGNYYYLYKNQNVNDYVDGYVAYSHYMYPHNNYIHVTAEIGVVGLLLFITIMNIPLILKIDQKQHQLIKQREKLFLICSIIILFLLTSMFESLMHAKHFIYAYTLLTLLFASIDISTSKESKMAIFISKLSVGGMEKALINFINYSNFKNKYKIDLYVGYLAEEEYLKMIPSSVNVKVICHNKWNFLNKIITYIKMQVLKISLVDNQYNISISYSYQHGIVASLARWASKNCYIFIHSDLVLSRTPKRLKKLLRSIKLEEFKGIICVSNSSRKSLIKIKQNLENKTITINNYINGDEIMTKAGTKKKKNKYCTFAVVSRINEKVKKISRVIEASKMLKDENYKFKVVIIGDGPDLDSYKEMVQKKKLTKVIKFYGKQINPYPFMYSSDAIILSSDYEGYPVIFLEAMVLGIPIISTNVSDAKKDISKENGIVVEKSVSGIYNGMKQFIDKPLIINNKFRYEEYNNNLTKKYENFIKE